MKKPNFGKMLPMSCLFFMQMLRAYDATVPLIHTPICSVDICTIIGNCRTNGNRPTDCSSSSMYRCSYAGPGIDSSDQCTNNPILQQYNTLKHYRISQVIGINNTNNNGDFLTFCAFSITWSPIDPLASDPHY